MNIIVETPSWNAVSISTLVVAGIAALIALVPIVLEILRRKRKLNLLADYRVSSWSYDDFVIDLYLSVSVHNPSDALKAVDYFYVEWLDGHVLHIPEDGHEIRFPGVPKTAELSSQERMERIENLHTGKQRVYVASFEIEPHRTLRKGFAAHLFCPPPSGIPPALIDCVELRVVAKDMQDKNISNEITISVDTSHRNSLPNANG